MTAGPSPFPHALSAVAGTIPPTITRHWGDTMRRTITLFTLVGCLALAGCSNSDDKPSAKTTATATATPSLSAAEARQACVDDWARWYEEEPEDYDPETDALPELPACEGRSDSAELGFEALKERNEANRERLDECLEDPTCTEFPSS